MPSRKDLANAVRALSMDAVQKANSGHPGAPMGMADIAEVLWNDHMVHNPANPKWSNRDRFYRGSYNGWFRYLVDVTDDPSAALDIGSVPVVVLEMAPGNYQGTVVAFTDLPVVSGSVVLRITPWPPLGIDIYNLTDHRDNGWWEGD